MIQDILSVIWKEFRELVNLRGQRRGGLMSILILVGVFGVFMPLQNGQEWFATPIPIFYYGWLPFILVSSVIADSFAGERERHTLDTLLASRLSDTAILYGKILAALAYGWGLTMLCAVLGVAAINLAFGHGKFLFYPAEIALGIFAFSLLVSGFVSGLGVLISLRAASVRQAQQTFSIAFFAIFVPFFAIPLLPEEWVNKATQVLQNLDYRTLGTLFALLLLVADLVLLGAARMRFRRDRLSLD